VGSKLFFNDAILNVAGLTFMPPGHIQNQEVDEDDREELEPQLR
jgi:hypothetical protein